MDDRLAILLEDYRLVSQTAATPFAPVSAIIATVIASALSVLTLNWTTNEPDSIQAIQPWLTSLAPLALLLPAIYSITIATEHTLLSFYCRALEREIRKEIELKQQDSESTRYTILNHSYPDLPIFSSHELTPAITGSGSIKRLGTLTTALFAIAFTFAYLALLRQAYINLLQISDILAAAVILCYVGIAIRVALRAIQATLRGREMFENAATLATNRAKSSLTPKQFSFKEFCSHNNITSARPSSTHTIGILAKPDDVPKLSNLVIGAIFASIVLSNDGFSRIRDSKALILLLGILLYELVIYQGRYVVNDLIGTREETLLSSRNERRRLSTNESDILKAIQSLLIRAIIVAATFTYVALSATGWSIVVGSVMLATITIPYELARYMQNATRGNCTKQYSWAILQFVLICFGIPLRLLVGYLLYTELLLNGFTAALKHISNNPFPLLSLLGWGAAYSLSSVTPTWSLEGLAEANSARSGVITFSWRAEGKRHIWISTRRLLRCLDILAYDSKPAQQPTDRVPELSGRQCWIDYSPKNTSYLRRLLRWGWTPWGIGTMLSYIASQVIISSTFQFQASLPSLILAGTLFIGLYAASVDATIVANKGITGHFLAYLTPAVPAILLLMLGSSTASPTTLVTSQYLLLLFGGPFWIHQLRGTYSDTRNLAAKIIAQVSTLDKQLACLIISRLKKDNAAPHR